MTAFQFFAIVAAIFLAPRIYPWMGIFLGVVYMALAVIAMVWK